jgi:hypothetical protein
VVYRSALATDNLQKMGYINAFSWPAAGKTWIDAGLETEVSTSSEP